MESLQAPPLPPPPPPPPPPAQSDGGGDTTPATPFPPSRGVFSAGSLGQASYLTSTVPSTGSLRSGASAAQGTSGASVEAVGKEDGAVEVPTDSPTGRRSGKETWSKLRQAVSPSPKTAHAQAGEDREPKDGDDDDDDDDEEGVLDNEGKAATGWKGVVSRILTRQRLEGDEDEDEDLLNQGHEAQRHIKAAKRTTGILADDPWVPFWEIVLLMFTLYFEIAVTLHDVYDNWSASVHLPLDILGSLVFTADIGVRGALQYYSALRNSQVRSGKHQSGRAGLVGYAKRWFPLDAASAFPLHLIFAASGSSTAHRIAYHLPMLRVFRGHTYFAQVNPEAMSARYIFIYYKVVPLVQLVFWSVYTLHLFVVVRLALIGSDRRAEDDHSYTTALYYVLYTVTTVGYGDVLVESRWEKIYAMFLFVFGTIANAVIIGTLSRMMQAHNIKSERKSRMLETLAVMQHFSIPKALQQEVLAFQAHILEHNMGSSYSEIIDGLPVSMQHHIGLYVRIKFVATVEMFKKADQACKRALAEVLQNVVYAPGQFIITAGEVGKEMFFVGHGYADVLTGEGAYLATVKKGDFVGEIALLIEGTLRTASIKALTYCDVFRLDKEDFNNVRQQYTNFNEQIIVEVQRRKQLQEDAERKKEAEKKKHLQDEDGGSALEMTRIAPQRQKPPDDPRNSGTLPATPEAGQLVKKGSELSGLALLALKTGSSLRLNEDAAAAAKLDVAPPPGGGSWRHSDGARSFTASGVPPKPPSMCTPNTSKEEVATPSSDTLPGLTGSGQQSDDGRSDDGRPRSGRRPPHTKRGSGGGWGGGGGDSSRSLVQFSAMQRSLGDIHTLVAAMEQRMGALEDAAMAVKGADPAPADASGPHGATKVSL